MTQTLQSVSQSLRVLTELRRRNSAGITELAEDLHLGPSTVHRILATLQQHGYVQQTATGRRYQLGPAMVHSSDAASIEHCVEMAEPVMLRLRDLTNETVHISVLEGIEARFVSVIESRQLLRVSSRVGRAIPAHRAASGKVLLAQLTDAAIDDLYQQECLTQVTAARPTRTAFKAELNKVREQGYGRNFGESEADLAAIAVALRRPRGIPICSLTLTGPLTRFQAPEREGISTREKQLRQLLFAAAAAIEKKLSY